MITHVRLSFAALADPVSDPLDRNVMPMSTLIASDMWLLEASWDGCAIGDVQVYKNQSCNANGVLMKDAKGKILKDDWTWWTGVPRGRIKTYRFVTSASIRPQTAEDEGMPFELPNAQRKEEPRQAGKGREAASP